MLNAYHIIEDGKETGPFTREELIERGIATDTLVLSPIATDWQHAGNLPEFQAYFEYHGIYVPRANNMAGFWWRALAYIIDYIIILITTLAIVAIWAIIASYVGWLGWYINFESADGETILRLILIVVMITYNALFETLSTQGSIGKIVCKLVVVDEYGYRVSFGKALGRNLGKILSSMVCGLGYFSVLWDKEKRSWHDHLAKAYVLRKTDAFLNMNRDYEVKTGA